MRFHQLLSLILILLVSPAFSQETKTAEEKQAEYLKTINSRADKIVANLGITDSQKLLTVRNIVANQYINLGKIYDARDAQKKAIKAEASAGGPKETIESKLKSLDEETTSKVNELHKQYLTELSNNLTEEQVDKVKDGMTYNLVHVTYTAYQAMIPSLKETEKKQIHDWLIEAREIAMDAESSDRKHFWFGKYKGRINNYLAKNGYDLKKEGEEWEKRRKEKAAADKEGK